MRPIDADKFIDYIGAGHLRGQFTVCFSERNLVDMINKQPTIEQPQWISVEDGLPETIACSAGTAYSEAVLLFTTGKKVLIGIFDGEGFLSDGIDYWDAEHDEVTHWMPLPQPPKETNNVE